MDRRRGGYRFSAYSINPKELDRFRDYCSAGRAKIGRQDSNFLAEALLAASSRSWPSWMRGEISRCLPSMGLVMDVQFRGLQSSR